MRLHVDEERCTGHGRCYALAPEVFEPDEEGMNAAGGTILEVAPGQEQAAQVGMDGCPEHAITVVS